MSMSPRWQRWGRRLLWTGAAVGAGVAITEVATENSLSRSARALSSFFRVVATYKLKTPETAEEYFAMHQYAADSILHVCLTNEGLYVKLGQGLNAMSHILPKEYTNTLKVLLDNAKPVAMPQVRRTVEEELGQKLEEVFERFDEAPVASASIAQVHKAWLRNPESTPGDERPPIPVAVKVRKPCIGRQSKWDIYTFQFLSFTVQHLFGLPTQWSRKTIVDGLKREMDFTIEASNAEHVRHNFRGDPHVYIPKIYKELSSTRLIVMEWIDAAKLSETEKIRENFNEKAVLKKLFDSFGDMIFKHGFVHCDPHAANVLVRHMPEPVSSAAAAASLTQAEGSASRNRSLSHKRDGADAGQQQHRPTKKSRNDYQIVLIDFGLCVPESERFRMLYALLFKSLVTRDMNSLRKVVADWGISDPEIFASLQMQKPLKSMRSGRYDEVTREEVREMQQEAHARIKMFMIDEAKIPRELPMVGRSVDILRGNNRLYGSPINRANMFIKSAVEALGPLHDYEGVQRYLARIRKIVQEAQAAEDRAAAAARIDLASHNSIRRVFAGLSSNRGSEGKEKGRRSATDALDESSFDSVYDDGALKMREEQAAAMRELAAERNSSLVARATNGAESLYRAFLFHLVMFSFSVTHHLTRVYNLTLKLLFPHETSEKLQLPSLEDRLDRMENSMHIE